MAGGRGEFSRIAIVSLGITIVGLFFTVAQTFISWGAWKDPVTSPGSDNKLPPNSSGKPLTKHEKDKFLANAEESKLTIRSRPDKNPTNTTPKELAPPQSAKMGEPSVQSQPDTRVGSSRIQAMPEIAIDLGDPNIFFYLGSKKPSITPLYAEGALVVLPEGKWGYQASPNKWAPGGWPVRVLGGNLTGKGSRVGLFLDDQYKSKSNNPFVNLIVASDQEAQSPWIKVSMKSGVLYTLAPSRRMKEIRNGSYFAKGKQEPSFLKLEITSNQVVFSNKEESEVGRLSYRGNLIMIQTNSGAFLGFADNVTSSLYLFRFSPDEGLTQFCESYSL